MVLNSYNKVISDLATIPETAVNFEWEFPI